MSYIFNLILRWFSKDNIAKVWKILFDGVVTATVALLTNKALMDAAFEISLSILGLKADGNEKAKAFDDKMADWCSLHGRPIPSKAEMNAIREVAYAAVRSQEEARARGLLAGI